MGSAAERERPRLTEREAIVHLVATAHNAGLFFDFDGVLAPIQLDPETVWPNAGAIDALEALVHHVKRVAIVSARPVAFLRPRFEMVSGLTLYGHYGLQTMTPNGQEATEPEAVPWIPVIGALADRARRELPQDVLVEEKPLSVSLHYRAAPEQEDTVRAWADEQVRTVGVAAQHGRMVVEMRPPVRRDKGDVIRQETTDLATAWYFGDDISDQRAFHALAEREGQSAGFVGVCVAIYNEETGQALAEAADIVIRPDAVPTFLGQLVNAFRGAVRE
jgi:trehalose 6-phosphate phosphatase